MEMPWAKDHRLNSAKYCLNANNQELRDSCAELVDRWCEKMDQIAEFDDELEGLISNIHNTMHYREDLIRRFVLTKEELRGMP